MKRLEGGICAVPGVSASGARQGKYGLALIAASGVAIGMFTTNRVRAAPLEVTAENLMNGWLDGVIANSGCANCYTGTQGIRDARDMARMMADFLKMQPVRIGVASTGVIGRPMDMQIIESLFQEAKVRLRSSPDASQEAARAIMTTDTRVKEMAVENKGVHVAGIVKGAGMIEPNMATMLCFIYTDADLPRDELTNCLAHAVADSFNMLSIDGDTSTNDTVLLTATGAKKCDVGTFGEALNYVCIELARMMARDGEGATKYFETVITGAGSKEDAQAAARSVARSSLVKAAVYGSDPNWGRIVAAVGRSGARLEPERITLSLEGNGRNVTLVDKGKIVQSVLDQAKDIMKGESIFIYVDLGLGNATARSFGCDLTHGYVDINANYTT
jgi:glutamate N-acetyltransferase / amino-acid N-acetyltransferase